MNLLAAELPGCTWLDLCSGSGVMACEALQRGARLVVAVEQDRRIAAVARANLDAVCAGLRAGPGPAPQCEVHCRDVRRWLATAAGNTASPREREPFHLIYADPPYAAGLYEPIAIGVAAGAWIRPGGTLVWECATDAIPEIPAGWRRRDERRYGGTSLVLLQPD
jgi:16S rRNA (guanine(966)-N(2))-methyltransferase RsmD